MGRHDGSLNFFVGASRSGKTQDLLTQVAKAPRLLVWDAEGEFSARYGLRSVEGVDELASAVRGKYGPQRIACQPRGRRGEFDQFCRLAWIWNLQEPGSIVCEEMAGQTNAGKARGSWLTLVTRGIKYEAHIFAVAQRAQEIDKSLLGNASSVHIFRPNTEDDALYIARRFGLQLSDIPDADLEALVRLKDRTLRRYRVTFPGGRPRMTAIKAFSRTF